MQFIKEKMCQLRRDNQGIENKVEWGIFFWADKISIPYSLNLISQAAYSKIMLKFTSYCVSNWILNQKKYFLFTVCLFAFWLESIGSIVV